MGLNPLDRHTSTSTVGPAAAVSPHRAAMSVAMSGTALGRASALATDAVTVAKFLRGPVAVTPVVTAPLEAVAQGPETRLAVPLQTQKGNACGTTALSMLMTYFDAPAVVRQVGAIDAAIRPSSRDGHIDSFTAPLDIARYAQRHGFQASLHNQSSEHDLARMIDQGVPPMILYDEAGDGSTLHYVLVTGYRDVDGKRQWTISNPSGFTHTKSSDGLLKAWSNLNIRGVSLQYSRLMIAIAPRTGTVTLPSGGTKPATALALPRQNTSKVVDWGGSIATSAIGVAAKFRDLAQSAQGVFKAGAAKIQRQTTPISHSVSGRLGR